MSNASLIARGLKQRGYHERAISEAMFNGTDISGMLAKRDLSDENVDFVTKNLVYQMNEREEASYLNEKRLVSFFFQVACARGIITTDQMARIMKVFEGKTDLLELLSYKYKLFEAKPELEELWNSRGEDSESGMV